ERCEPHERVVGESTTILQVALDDALALWVSRQPLAALAEQLVHLVLPNPVVLVSVEHGDQDIQVGQQVANTHIPGERHPSEWPGSLGPRAPIHLDRVAKGLEESAYPIGSAVVCVSWV